MTNSNTHKKYLSLLGKGYEAELKIVYSNAYNQDYNYLSIQIPFKEINNIEALISDCKGFDVLVEKHTDKGVSSIKYNIRKQPRFADLVKTCGDVEFDRLLKREPIVYDSQNVFSQSDWKSQLKNKIV